MNRICLIGCLLFLCMGASAQKFMQMEDKAFDFGVKVGFNATFPVVNSLMIDGNRVSDISVQYKVGYLAAVFCRVNIERFFLQPSLAWHKSEGELNFNLPLSAPTAMETAAYEKSDRLKMTTRSVEVPVMVGYSLVRKGPYGLSVMAGPKFKYNYKIVYESELADVWETYTSHSKPFGIHIATGVGVSIGRLFFDFVYEFGLNQTETDFRATQEAGTTMAAAAAAMTSKAAAGKTRAAGATHDFRIDKRTNVMSFSLGFLF